RETPGRPVSAGPSSLFAKLADRPSEEGERALDELAAAIAGKPQMIELRGFAGAEADASLAFRRTRRALDELVARGVRPGRFRLRTGGFAVTRPPNLVDAPPPDRVEVWVLDRLAVDPRAGF
ncbi:MAG: hypothetical protein AAF907_07740, partial [Planctomycetota bacterium]